MSKKFDLERRAEELYPGKSHLMDCTLARERAIQLASELAEACAAECDGLVRKAEGVDHEVACAYQHAATIARSLARPRSREDVYREALERIVRDGLEIDHSYQVAQRALDEAEKVRP